jgi:hypothetical protein
VDEEVVQPKEEKGKIAEIKEKQTGGREKPENNEA